MSFAPSTPATVTPAKAGVQSEEALRCVALDSSLRWNDGKAISLEGSVG